MKFLIADDHTRVRKGLKELLAEAFPHAHFEEAGNGIEVVSLLANCEYTALLLDLNMPGRNGMDVLRDVKSICPRLPVIMVSAEPAKAYASRCLHAGASAYISKQDASEGLVSAMKHILGSRA